MMLFFISPHCCKQFNTQGNKIYVSSENVNTYAVVIYVNNTVLQARQFAEYDLFLVNLITTQK